MNNKNYSQEQLTDLAIQFQKGLISRRVFMSKVSYIVLNIPKKFNVVDEDETHEFYAHVLSKIDDAIARYKKQDNASFYAWFNRVLMRLFNNFQIHKKSKIVFEDEQNLKRYYQKIEHPLFSNNFMNQELNFGHDYFEKIVKGINFSVFNETEKKIIAYKYGIAIKKYDLLPTIDEISKKIEKKRTLENIAAKIHYKILKLQEQSKTELDKEKLEKIRQKEQKARKTKKKIENQINHYKILPSNTWIAKKFGMPRMTIVKSLQTIKFKLNKQLSKKIL